MSNRYAVFWTCDRCGITVTEDGVDPKQAQPEIPVMWRVMVVGEGATASRRLELCDECSTDLYRWVDR